ncbi:MAG: single-stranded-DNA-specific exonuclease RecJ [Bacillota bacterium]
MHKFWELNCCSTKNSENIIDNILEMRNLKTAEEKQIFLESDLKYLSDPFDFKGMQKAVKRLKKAAENKEKIMIYGDYDVDGITSTAIFYLYFKKRFGLEVKYYLPDRKKEGYGLNKDAIEKIAEQNIDLLISVDCGINAVEEVNFAKNLGMDVIITDHHTPEKDNTAAVAVINPHFLQKDHFAADLAGVGVVYKICEALEIDNGYNFEEILYKLLPLAALGTVADIAKLTNENRILVKHGLNNMNSDYIPGLNILIEKLKLNQNEISAGHISYIIAPPLNAAGRIDSAEKALELLITENQNRAEKIAEFLIKINKKRQKKEEKIYQQALQKIEESSDIIEGRAIILADKRWHSGIIGIVASKLVEKYHLPVILIAVDKDNGTGKGSCRSISSLNMFNILSSCRDNLLTFGGHHGAAGLTIDMDNFLEFKKNFSSFLKENLKKSDFIPRLKVDMMLNLNNISKKFIRNLDKLKPFGIANPSPKFLIRNIEVNNCFRIGREEKHLKFNINNKLSAVAFNMGHMAEQIKYSKIDAVCQPEINCWQGRENLQLKLIDIKLSNTSSDKVVAFDSEKIKIFDYRENNNKLLFLKELLNFYQNDNNAVYISSQRLKKTLSEEFKKVSFFSNHTGCKKNIKRLIFYSLPFSLEHLSEILYSIKNRDEKLEAVFLFSKKDIALNKKLINSNCPDRTAVSECYIFLKKEQHNNEDLNIIKNNFLNKDSLQINTENVFEESIEILSQIGLIEVNNDAVFFNDPEENKLDLSNSIRYNKLSRQMEKFDDFVSAAYGENLFDLIDLIKNFEEENDES